MPTKPVKAKGKTVVEPNQDVTEARRDFATLSIKDLLEARDLYHFHLINRRNVVGTAVGRYLIRKHEHWPTHPGENMQPRPAKPGHASRERTFQNSEVRDYSWPCILVLVREWLEDYQFGSAPKQPHPEELIPRTLYLPDGRSVPVCIVKVDPTAPQTTTVDTRRFRDVRLQPGCPILVDRQGERRVATAGCLVTDGHTTYALTNRHVAGTPGQAISSIVRGRPAVVGQASEKQVTRAAFNDVYPEFPGRRTFVSLDIGLVELRDTSPWTARPIGLGKTGELADLNEANMSFGLIDTHVVAHGAASGGVRGQIKALFYRYKSVAGYDYVADFVIAPISATQTQPGDSGMVWHLEPSKDAVLRPIAVEWGAQSFTGEGGHKFNFALATSLSNACKWLDVELVGEDSTSARPYWGETGHYSIATYACQALPKNSKLADLMNANVEQISFSGLDPKAMQTAANTTEAGKGTYIPLADVPDIVWKNYPSKVPGGRDDRPSGHGSTGPEHPNHFADIDEPRDSDGKTLRQLSLEKPETNLTLEFWRAFYTECGHKTFDKRGLLPFRVWQFFLEMVDAVENKDADRFVAAAGVVSHYVGDACQPLHGSMYADGYSDKPITTTHHKKDTGEEYEKQSNEGAGVHSAYESKMIDRKSAEMLEGLEAAAKGSAKLVAIGDGKAAALEIVKLMDRAATALPPSFLIDTYIHAGGKPNNTSYDALWDAAGDKTIGVLWDGARILASIWQAAWTLGGEDTIPKSDRVQRDRDALQKLYEDPTWVPSKTLDELELGESAPAPAARTARRVTRRKG